MNQLARFNPFLTGSVLSGTAGKYADINVHLYTDDGKDVELFLLNRGIGYRAGERRLWCGDTLRTLPAFTVEHRGTEVELVVFARDDLRQPVRTNPEGKPLERAKAEAVQTLLASSAL
jgi:hypothetical protein